jgi:hypothetical protein
MLDYSSKTDSRGFSITQEKTTMQNNDLPNILLSKVSDAHQAETASGKTIYIYNGSNATWVDNGVWYNIQGNANLSADQLRQVASSL